MVSIRFFQLVLLFCFSCQAFAIEVPSLMYRTDTRPPDEIFQNGFESWGDEIEVLRHVLGTSIVEKKTGLIATTSEMSVAWDIASKYLIDENNEQDHIWIYLITPGINFYNVNSSLLNAYMHGTGDLVPSQALFTYATFSHEHEFAAESLIVNTQIKGAARIKVRTRPDGEEEIYVEKKELNGAYNPTTPEVSSEFLPAIEMPADFDVYYEGDLRLYPITAALGVSGYIGRGTKYKKTKFSTLANVIKEKGLVSFD
jgi:hypothetical protein